MKGEREAEPEEKKPAVHFIRKPNPKFLRESRYDCDEEIKKRFLLKKQVVERYNWISKQRE